jgi:pyruvate dehydrogenase E2 component (dihydrolipoamide acetyltransferase)
MATEVLIPKLGMTMTEGTVAEWLVADGATVREGDPVYRLETEKIEMDVEAEAEGVVRHVVAEGTTLDPGAVVAYILAAGEALPAGVPAAAAPAAVEAVASPAPVRAASLADGDRAPASPAARRLAAERGIDLELVAGTGPGGRVTEGDVLAFVPPGPGGREARISPLARRLAESLGVDLANVTGTGPGGRITKDDVEAAAARSGAPAAAAPAPRVLAAVEGREIAVKGMRRVIAERMHESLQSMAQLTMTMDAWMDEAVRLRAGLIEEWAGEGARPTYTDLVLRAVAKALPQHPLLNAEFQGASIVLHEIVHLGLAVAVENGLVVPVIRDADRRSLKELAVESSRLAEAARAGKLGPDDYAGGTFSVSPLGMFGVDAFTPIINPPNAAILGVGRIRDAIAWDGDRPLKRQSMTMSLTWDHRVADGVPAARFLQAVKELLEAPYRLLA